MDLFSSVGGLTIGASEAAFALGMDIETVAAVDLDREALNVYRRNHISSDVITSDIDDLVRCRTSGGFEQIALRTTPAIDGALAKHVGSVDLVIAGPPCQGHSSLNNHTRGSDERNRLYLSPVIAAIGLGAPMVVIENVPGVVNDMRGVVESAKRILKKHDYFCAPEVTLRADALGWPQTRKRHFLVASKLHPPVSPELTAMAISRGAALPMSWAVSDLRRASGTDSYNSVSQLSEDNKRRIAWLDASGQDTLADEERPEKHRLHPSRRSSYGRMAWDKPAPTLTTGFLTPGRGRYVHPKESRTLTPHEAARIQGFPDWFQFNARSDGSDAARTDLAKWIGDAVPSILGFAACLSPLADFAT